MTLETLPADDNDAGAVDDVTTAFDDVKAVVNSLCKLGLETINFVSFESIDGEDCGSCLDKGLDTRLSEMLLLLLVGWVLLLLVGEPHEIEVDLIGASVTA